MTSDSREPRSWPEWLVWFVFVCLVGGMFWCIDVGANSSWLTRIVFIGCIAGIIAMPHVPRRKDHRP